MSLKPAIIRNVSTDVVSMSKALGPKLGKLYVANPNVSKYAFVFKFPDGVATGRAVARAIQKIQGQPGPTLIAGDQFTLEARQLAAAEGCDLVSYELANAHVWTDARYAKAREPLS